MVGETACPVGPRAQQWACNYAGAMTSSSGPRIVAFAYNCDPDAGSEGGVGWAWSQLLAGVGPTTVVVRDWPGRRSAIEQALAGLPADRRPVLAFVDLPSWLRPLARRHHSQRIEYLVWMREALVVARRLNARQPFDLAWHLTWANAWIGTVASRLGIPFVYGPVGAGVGPPWRIVPSLGLVEAFAEVARSGFRWAGRYLNPFARQAWQAADLILVQNPETRQWLPDGVRDRVSVMPNALFLDMPERRAARAPADQPVVLFAGRMLGWKGLGLVLRALVRLPGWQLIVCGDGRAAGGMHRLAARLRVGDRVDFRGWTTRDEVLRLMREEADVLAFPSLHDEGAWVVAEATMVGLPVVCLDRGGPAILGGRPVRGTGLEATVLRLARGLRDAVGAETPELAWPMDLEGRRRAVLRLLDAHGLISTTSPHLGAEPAAGPPDAGGS